MLVPKDVPNQPVPLPGNIEDYFSQFMREQGPEQSRFWRDISAFLGVIEEENTEISV